jgi:hypothetical protein
MLALDLAEQLRAAGLEWTPALHDFFALPGTALAGRVFVITDIPANVAMIQGQAAFTFEGAAEWAMDYVFANEAVWMPTESQLRQAVEARAPNLPMRLHVSPVGYECALDIRADATLSFRATSAEDAYAQALIFLLQKS